jgi:hypothetical protein
MGGGGGVDCDGSFKWNADLLEGDAQLQLQATVSLAPVLLYLGLLAYTGSPVAT